MKSKLSPPLKWALYLSPLLLFGIAAKVLNTDPPTNTSQTSPDTPDPALRSRVVRLPWTEAVRLCEQVLGEQRTYGRAWKHAQTSVSGTAPGAQLTEVLRAQVPVFVFTDDFEVILRDEGNGQIRIDARSAARLGKGDFGENRRHVLQFLAALDEKLKR